MRIVQMLTGYLDELRSKNLLKIRSVLLMTNFVARVIGTSWTDCYYYLRRPSRNDGVFDSVSLALSFSHYSKLHLATHNHSLVSGEQLKFLSDSIFFFINDEKSVQQDKIWSRFILWKVQRGQTRVLGSLLYYNTTMATLATTSSRELQKLNLGLWQKCGHGRTDTRFEGTQYTGNTQAQLVVSYWPKKLPISTK